MIVQQNNNGSDGIVGWLPHSVLKTDPTLQLLLITYPNTIVVSLSKKLYKLLVDFQRYFIMTTAARPTFEPAKGGMGRGERDLSALSKQYSARDLPSHTRLKYREHGQASSEEVRSRDFRRELEDRERANVEKRSSGNRSGSSRDSAQSKKPRLDQIAPANLDADDPQDEDEDASDSDSDSDDEAALYAELERIRRERAEDEARKERERAEQEERIRMENIISGNPLLNIAGAPKADMKVRKRWDDDVVFKNCGGDQKQEKTFINDSLRSEFHKKFMEKYIK